MKHTVKPPILLKVCLVTGTANLVPINNGHLCKLTMHCTEGVFFVMCDPSMNKL